MAGIEALLEVVELQLKTLARQLCSMRSSVTHGAHRCIESMAWAERSDKVAWYGTLQPYCTVLYCTVRTLQIGCCAEKHPSSLHQNSTKKRASTPHIWIFHSLNSRCSRSAEGLFWGLLSGYHSKSILSAISEELELPRSHSTCQCPVEVLCLSRSHACHRHGSHTTGSALPEDHGVPL